MKQLTKMQQLYAINALRRASYKWPARMQAFKLAKRGWGKYECAECGEIFGRKDVQLDHIDPVVPTTGFDNLQDYAIRLYAPVEGWQVLDTGCHQKKSTLENQDRRVNRRKGQAFKARKKSK